MRRVFQKGVLNLVTNGPGGSGAIGDEFIENPKVRRISLTGSSEVGRQLAEKAGRYLKRVALELGGQNPMIILQDANVDDAVNAAAFGAFLHQGQICMSTRRIIMEKPIAKEFTEKFVRKVFGLQGRQSEGTRHDHRPAYQPAAVRPGKEEHRGRRRRRREDPVRRQIRGALLLPDRAHQRKARHGLLL